MRNDYILNYSLQHFVVQLFSRVWLFVTPWTTACQASLSFNISQSLLKLMPSSQWCHPAISSSVIPFSSCLQSFPASGSFPMSCLFTSGGQSTGASVSESSLPMNTQDWFPLGLTSLISSQSKGLSRVFSKTQFESINSLAFSLFYGPTLKSIHDYWKNHSFGSVDLPAKRCLCLLIHCLGIRLSSKELPRSKHLWFHGFCHNPRWFWSLRK